MLAVDLLFGGLCGVWTGLIHTHTTKTIYTLVVLTINFLLGGLRGVDMTQSHTQHRRSIHNRLCGMDVTH